MRNLEISIGEYYHLYNRGYGKQLIFLDERDIMRFLFIILYFQSSVTQTNLNRPVSNFVKHSVFNIDTEDFEKTRTVDLIAFVFMPNHFHLIVGEKQESGIANYMQRALNAYTKYFNAKYKRTGHLFQGPYQAVHVETNEQLLHLSAYVHKNPKDMAKWEKNPHEYKWSSYQDYVKENRWGKLLNTDLILSQFSIGQDYFDFVTGSIAKEIKSELKKLR